jgi:dipeptidyl aminopeptidase/acylaminoacyl peptidase
MNCWLAFAMIATLLLASTSLAQQTQGQQGRRQQASGEQTADQKAAEEIQQQIRELQQRLSEIRAREIAARNAARYARQIEDKKQDDDLIRKLSAGAVDFKKVTYRSSIGDLDIPAYLFQPLKPRGSKGHPALVWVHGGVASSFGSGYMPFVKQAVERGYIVIAPEYRGSTGYGEAFQEAIDYGGYEVEDSMSAADYLKANVPSVDPERIGMIGWSHGGYITLFSLIRDQNKTFKCGYAGVPVTNLVFRLSYKGPGYEANFVKQKRIGGEVHQKRDIYIERSPVYHVDKIKVPVLVHVATNDTDVNFVEDQMMIHALKYHIPHLADTKIYADPPGEHGFDRLVNGDKTAPRNTEAQRDSWNRIWTFLEGNLKPYLGVNGEVVLQ